MGTWLFCTETYRESSIKGEGGGGLFIIISSPFFFGGGGEGGLIEIRDGEGGGTYLI